MKRATLLWPARGSALGTSVPCCAVITASVCEITWGLRNRRLVARCADCDTSYEVTDRAELDGWALALSASPHPTANMTAVSAIPPTTLIRRAIILSFGS